MSELRAGEPRHFHGITIIPIQRVCFFHENKGKGFWAYGSKEPVAIIVGGVQDVRILDLESTGISMESLQQEIPELTNILAELKGRCLEQIYQQSSS